MVPLLLASAGRWSNIGKDCPVAAVQARQHDSTAYLVVGLELVVPSGVALQASRPQLHFGFLHEDCRGCLGQSCAVLPLTAKLADQPSDQQEIPALVYRG